MSELMNTRCDKEFRDRLLMTVSASALFFTVAMTYQAKAESDDAPILWIEVGGSFDQINESNTLWLPPNITPAISNPRSEPFGKLPSIGYDTDLKLSFAPENSDWIFSASMRYGRAQHGPRHLHDQTYKSLGSGGGKYLLSNYDFINAYQQSRSTHAILDFTAGKDFGLGLLGHGKSTINFGVRIAQMTENAHGQLTAFTNASAKYSPGEVGHKAQLLVSRSFNGIGPSVAWDASAPMVGSLSDGFSFDWGANAAFLFGRQKANVHLHTQDARYYAGTNYMNGIPTILTHQTKDPSRVKTVVVPNIGGFAGLSWHLPSVKVSLGYRADFFFGAIDGGLASSKSETRGFYGPFANVSIGIGG
jgi:hypothetical protein